jgi:hypothetical protein
MDNKNQMIQFIDILRAQFKHNGTSNICNIGLIFFL